MDKKILIVDDEADIREILQFNLENAGFAVECAASAEEALEMLCPDHGLILLDVMMGFCTVLEQKLSYAVAVVVFWMIFRPVILLFQIVHCETMEHPINTCHLPVLSICLQFP